MADAVRFLVDDVFDGATISSSTNVTGLDPGNVQSPLIRKVWRSTNSPISDWLKLDAGAATTINQIFLGGINLTTGAIITVRAHASDLGSNSNVWSSSTLSQQVVLATDSFGGTLNYTNYFFSSNQSYRYWFIHFQDQSAPEGYIECGRVMAGRYIQPTIDVNEGFSYAYNDPTVGTRVGGRQSYYKTRKRYLEGTYSVQMADNVQSTQFLDIYRRMGDHQPFVVAFEPESRPIHRSIYAQFDNRPTIRHTVGKQFDIQQVTFSEKN